MDDERRTPLDQPGVPLGCSSLRVGAAQPLWVGPLNHCLPFFGSKFLAASERLLNNAKPIEAAQQKLIKKTAAIRSRKKGRSMSFSFCVERDVPTLANSALKSSQKVFLELLRSFSLIDARPTLRACQIRRPGWLCIQSFASLSNPYARLLQSPRSRSSLSSYWLARRPLQATQCERYDDPVHFSGRVEEAHLGDFELLIEREKRMSRHFPDAGPEVVRPIGPELQLNKQGSCVDRDFNRAWLQAKLIFGIWSRENPLVARCRHRRKLPALRRAEVPREFQIGSIARHADNGAHDARDHIYSNVGRHAIVPLQLGNHSVKQNIAGRIVHRDGAQAKPLLEVGDARSVLHLNGENGASRFATLRS